MIGTRLCELLEECGIRWTGLDLRPNTWSAHIDERTLRLDVRDIEACAKQIPEDIGLIVHLAAHSRVFPMIQDPTQGIDNCQTVYSALELARRKGIAKIIFASSREVYGEGSGAAFVEGDASQSTCENAYAASKIMGEAFLWSYLRTFGVEFAILRFGNAYGRYDMSDRIIPRLIRQCVNGEDVHIFGKDKILDFVYLDDLVDGIIRTIDRFATAKNSVYNIASQTGTSLLALAELIHVATKSKSSISVEENRQGEVMKCVVDISRARSMLGYEPSTSLDEGIQKAIAWYTPYVSKK